MEYNNSPVKVTDNILENGKNKIYIINVLVYHLNGFADSIQKKLDFISKKDDNLFKSILSSRSLSEVPFSSIVINETLLISFEVLFSDIFQQSAVPSSNFVSLLSCADFSSIYISILQCLINLSLFPSQKESLRMCDISVVLLKSIENVRLILRFIDWFSLSFSFSFSFFLYFLFFYFISLVGKQKIYSRMKKIRRKKSHSPHKHHTHHKHHHHHRHSHHSSPSSQSYSPSSSSSSSYQRSSDMNSSYKSLLSSSVVIPFVSLFSPNHPASTGSPIRFLLEMSPERYSDRNSGNSSGTVVRSSLSSLRPLTSPFQIKSSSFSPSNEPIVSPIKIIHSSDNSSPLNKLRTPSSSFSFNSSTQSLNSSELDKNYVLSFLFHSLSNTFTKVFSISFFLKTFFLRF
jgi:hypothetical protein